MQQLVTVNCKTCGKAKGFLDNITVGKDSIYCRNCKNNHLKNFRNLFLNHTSSGYLADSGIQDLNNFIATYCLDKNDATKHIQKDLSNLLHNHLLLAEQNDYLSEDSEKKIASLIQTMAPPPQSIQPIMQRFSYIKTITNIRSGKFPNVHTNARLESDEICHMELKASFIKVSKTSTNYLPGQLLATNKKLHFLSPTGGKTINWNQIMRVIPQKSQNHQIVYIEAGTKNGTGRYIVYDAKYVAYLLDTLVKISKRELVLQYDPNSRHIPQNVRTAVWQRDGGRCVQCGISGPNANLEYDHIIPFDKGGANTFNNVQLLCRRCNLAKSNKI